LLIAHLDTGANQTELHNSVQPLASKAERAAMTTRSMRVAGVSGEVERKIGGAPRLSVGVGRGRCGMEKVAFGEEAADAQGRLGADLIRACSEVRLDFDAMRIEVVGG
jgi:hypothetical protein